MLLGLSADVRKTEIRKSWFQSDCVPEVHAQNNCFRPEVLILGADLIGCGLWETRLMLMGIFVVLPVELLELRSKGH